MNTEQTEPSTADLLTAVGELTKAVRIIGERVDRMEETETSPEDQQAGTRKRRKHIQFTVRDLLADGSGSQGNFILETLKTHKYDFTPAIFYNAYYRALAERVAANMKGPFRFAIGYRYVIHVVNDGWGELEGRLPDGSFIKPLPLEK